MCIDVRKKCSCGKHEVQFHLRDNVLSEEVIISLYCPECLDKKALNPETMLKDNDWVIEYDMDLATFYLTSKLMWSKEMVRPGAIFDGGYCCWLEMYPGEKEEIATERSDIIKLQKTDPARYLQEISNWNISRVKRLKEEGWRKAQAA